MHDIDLERQVIRLQQLLDGQVQNTRDLNYQMQRMHSRHKVLQQLLIAAQKQLERVCGSNVPDQDKRSDPLSSCLLEIYNELDLLKRSEQYHPTVQTINIEKTDEKQTLDTPGNDNHNSFTKALVDNRPDKILTETSLYRYD